jgi:hypothetical protein
MTFVLFVLSVKINKTRAVLFLDQKRFWPIDFFLQSKLERNNMRSINDTEIIVHISLRIHGKDNSSLYSKTSIYNFEIRHETPVKSISVTPVHFRRLFEYPYCFALQMISI